MAACPRVGADRSADASTRDSTGRRADPRPSALLLVRGRRRGAGRAHPARLHRRRSACRPAWDVHRADASAAGRELLAEHGRAARRAVPACASLGVAAAWLVERTTCPVGALFAVLLAAPLAIPAFVASYGWISVVPSLHGLAGGVLIATLAYLPARLPAGRGHTAPARPGARGGRRRSRAATRDASASASSCRSCGCRSSAARCSSGCTCSPSTARSRCSASTPSRPRSSSSTARPSTDRRQRRSPRCSCCAASCLLLVENAARGGARYARVGSGAPRPRWPTRLGRAGLPMALLLATLSDPGSRRPIAEHRSLACPRRPRRLGGPAPHPGAGPDRRRWPPVGRS